MDRKKRLEDFVKDVYSKYNPDEESKDLLLRMCHSLYEQCPTDKELEEKLEKIEDMYKSMHELRNSIREIRQRMSAIRKESGHKFQTRENHINGVLELYNGVIHAFYSEAAIDALKDIKKYEN